ncbi:HNH endonuclease [Aeromonas veronii]|uniref:HNH endonuclease n=1 Tax=Aeromonas veronii TaxID=654 RepID=UPI003D25A86B
MWTLSPLEDIDEQEIIDTALTYKNGEVKYALSDAEKVSIEKIYVLYDLLKGRSNDNLKGLNALSQESLTAMHDAYGEVQTNGRLSDYRSKILLSAKRCPCCSIIDADEVDHYLPRSIFNSLSLYSKNLMPLCHKCNNTKRTNNDNGNNRFLHSYFAEVPDNENFLIAITTITNGALTVDFEIKKTKNLSQPTYEMMKFQMGKVKLNARLKKEINIFLAPYPDMLEMIYNTKADAAKVSTFLIKSAHTFKKNFGLNDWRIALLFSLSNNNDFCEGGFRTV